MRFVPVLIRALLVKVAERVAKLQFKEALVEVFAVPHGLLFDAFHEVALDAEGGNVEVVA